MRPRSWRRDSVLEGHGFSRATTPAKNQGLQPLRPASRSKTSVLEGHGFSRAATPGKNQGLQPLRPASANFAIAPRWRIAVPLMAALLALGVSAYGRSAAVQNQDYLTHDEADKIRDAYTSNARIKLFLDFAADRIARFERERTLKNPGPRQTGFLNNLLDAFSSCVDEAQGYIDDALTNGHDVRVGIQDFQKRVPDFFSRLEKIRSSGADIAPYHYALGDAIADMREDLQDVAKVKKQLELHFAKPKGGGGN